MKFLIYAIGLAIVILIIRSLQALKKKGYKKTSSILKFNFLLIIPAIVASGFVMSRFQTSPYSSRFDKSHGDTDAETIVTDKVSGEHFVIPAEYSAVEFGKYFGVVTTGLEYDRQVYTPKGAPMTGVLPYLYNNAFLLFWVVFIFIEGLGNWLWIRRVTKREIQASDSESFPPEQPMTDTFEERMAYFYSQQDRLKHTNPDILIEPDWITPFYKRLGLPSGTMWQDVHPRATRYPKDDSMLPTIEQAKNL